MDRRSFLKTSAGAPLAATAAYASSGATAEPAARADRPAGGFNETIQRARQAALDVLKPSRRDLEHGLELHAASLVADCYGFSPRAALDVEAYRKVAESGASAVELEDLREEMSMTRSVTDPAQRAEYQEAWDAAGVTCIFQNAGEESQAPLRILKRLARFTYVTDMLRDFVVKAATPDDIVAAKKAGRHCLYFSSNGVPLAQIWENVESEMQYLRIFFQLGIRMMHITYNRRNMLGDGCGEANDGGLSDFGRACVAEMNRLGVIPDVAHSGWQTSLDTAKASRRPMVASHSGCDAVHHHIRSKPDRVIRAICDTGGYIGVCAIGGFLGGRGDLNAMLDHIQYVAKKFGADHVAIGTDIAYSARTAPGESQRMLKIWPSRRRWEYLWPAGALGGTSHPSLAWTNWPMFTVGMVQRGLPDDDIQKILGGNMLRVARASLSQ